MATSFCALMEGLTAGCLYLIVVSRAVQQRENNKKDKRLKEKNSPKASHCSISNPEDTIFSGHLHDGMSFTFNSWILDTSS